MESGVLPLRVAGWRYRDALRSGFQGTEPSELAHMVNIRAVIECEPDKVLAFKTRPAVGKPQTRRRDEVTWPCDHGEGTGGLGLISVSPSGLPLRRLGPCWLNARHN